MWCAYCPSYVAHLVCFFKNIVLPKFAKGGDCCSFWIDCIIQNNMVCSSCFCEERTHVGTNVPACDPCLQDKVGVVLVRISVTLYKNICCYLLTMCDVICLTVV